MEIKKVGSLLFQRQQLVMCPKDDKPEYALSAVLTLENQA